MRLSCLVHVSSDSRMNSLPCPLPPATQNHVKAGERAGAEPGEFAAWRRVRSAASERWPGFRDADDANAETIQRHRWESRGPSLLEEKYCFFLAITGWHSALLRVAPPGSDRVVSSSSGMEPMAAVRSTVRIDDLLALHQRLMTIRRRQKKRIWVRKLARIEALV